MFNLNRHVRETLAGTSAESIDDLVSDVLGGIRSRDFGEALRQALPTYIRTQVGAAERPTDSRLGQEGADAQFLSTEAGNSSPDGEARADSQPRHDSPAVGGNSRVALFRAHRFRITVWIGDKQYRSILECTIDNLEHAAAESDRHAESNAARARQYRRLTKVMRERGVAVVAELTDVEIEEALRDD